MFPRVVISMPCNVCHRLSRLSFLSHPIVGLLPVKCGYRDWQHMLLQPLYGVQKCVPFSIIAMCMAPGERMMSITPGLLVLHYTMRLATFTVTATGTLSPSIPVATECHCCDPHCMPLHLNLSFTVGVAPTYQPRG